MRGSFPKIPCLDVFYAALLVAIVATGSLGIAIGTWRAMTGFDARSELASTYRAGDNPWRYAWSGPGVDRIPQNAPNALAQAAPASDGMAANAGAAFSILAQVTVPFDGADGMIITQGGSLGGWAFYLDHGRPVFHYNLDGTAHYTIAADRALAHGHYLLVVSVGSETKEAGDGAVATITANGEEIARGKIGKTPGPPSASNEGIAIGEDSGTPVNDAYQLPFKFRGEIVKVIVNFHRPASGNIGLLPAFGD
jgi:hypothetical protein